MSDSRLRYDLLVTKLDYERRGPSQQGGRGVLQGVFIALGVVVLLALAGSVAYMLLHWLLWTGHGDVMRPPDN